MPRQKNTRPTTIYWLYDTRPQTVAAFGPMGKPFYCGKTVYDVEFRLRGHRQAAITRPHRPLSVRLAEIGDHVHVRTVEIVSSKNDWIARERHWIRELRLLVQDVANVSDGGEGTPGFVPNIKTRLKMRLAKLGKKFSPQHRAKLSEAHLGRKLPPRSPEHAAKLTAAKTGKKRAPFSAESREKMSRAKIGKPISADHYAKLMSGNLRWRESKGQ